MYNKTTSFRNSPYVCVAFTKSSLIKKLNYPCYTPSQSEAADPYFNLCSIFIMTKIWKLMYRAASLRIIKYDLNRFTGVITTGTSKYSECLSVSLSRRWTDEPVLGFRGAARRDPASGVFNQHTVRAHVRLTAAQRRPLQSGEGHWLTVGPHPVTRTSRQTWDTWRRVQREDQHPVLTESQVPLSPVHEAVCFNEISR